MDICNAWIEILLRESRYLHDWKLIHGSGSQMIRDVFLSKVVIGCCKERCRLLLDLFGGNYGD